jgi:dTDP-4-dehydrorhamnose reductase
MKILLTGATGQLGREICRARLPSGTRLIAASRTQLDLARPLRIGRFVAEIAPDLVINTAAYTAVERAECEPDRAFAVNRDGAAALAEAAARLGAPIVHISTSDVFDGRKCGEWTEDDRPNPMTVLGQSKLIGEFAVAAANPRHLIIRTSWLYAAAHGEQWQQTVLRLGLERSARSVAPDEIGRPTSAADLAATLLAMAAAAMNTDSHWGTYHVSNGGHPVSWHNYARALLRNTIGTFGAAPVTGITDPEPAADESPPRNAILDVSKLGRVFGLAPRPWQAAMREVLNEMGLNGAYLQAV